MEILVWVVLFYLWMNTTTILIYFNENKDGVNLLDISILFIFWILCYLYKKE